MQDCSISSALAMEMLQSCTKPTLCLTSSILWIQSGSVLNMTKQWTMHDSADGRDERQDRSSENSFATVTSVKTGSCDVAKCQLCHHWWHHHNSVFSFKHIEAKTKWPITFSNEFSWMKMLELQFKFHCNLFPGIQLPIYQHWFRQWLVA